VARRSAATLVFVSGNYPKRPCRRDGRERRERTLRPRCGREQAWTMRPAAPCCALLHPAAPCCALLRPAAPCCALLRPAAPCCALLRPAAPRSSLMLVPPVRASVLEPRRVNDFCSSNALLINCRLRFVSPTFRATAIPPHAAHLCCSHTSLLLPTCPRGRRLVSPSLPARPTS
jgi:hypothetical protein